MSLNTALIKINKSKCESYWKINVSKKTSFVDKTQN